MWVALNRGIIKDTDGWLDVEANGKSRQDRLYCNGKLASRDDFNAHPSQLGSDLMLVKQALAGATGRPGVKVMTCSSRVGTEPSRPSLLQHIMYQGSKTWWVRMQVVSISVGKSSLPLMMKVKSPYQSKDQKPRGRCFELLDMAKPASMSSSTLP